MSPHEQPARVEVVYRAERDVEKWAARHAAGEVPGRWPYGLDLLASTGAKVSARGLAEPTRVDRLRARAQAAVRPRRRTPAAHDPLDIGIAWDENVARRMLVAAPHAQMYSGAIWLTDALAAHTSAPRVRATLATLRRMDGVLVNSRAQVEPLRAALGSPGPAIEFFHFGVDAHFFAAQPYPERPLVVSVGGDRDRDPVTLFAALERVVAVRRDVEIVVQSASDVPPPPGVTKVLHLTHVELRALYARASVVAVATRPNLHMSGLTVSLESMATARPVVLTASPGVEDYVTDGQNAHLVPTGDPDALAARVLALLDAPADARDLGERARAGIEARLTSAHMVQAMARAVGLV